MNFRGTPLKLWTCEKLHSRWKACRVKSPRLAFLLRQENSVSARCAAEEPRKCDFINSCQMWELDDQPSANLRQKLMFCSWASFGTNSGGTQKRVTARCTKSNNIKAKGFFRQAGTTNTLILCYVRSSLRISGLQCVWYLCFMYVYLLFFGFYSPHIFGDDFWSNVDRGDNRGEVIFE